MKNNSPLYKNAIKEHPEYEINQYIIQEENETISESSLKNPISLLKCNSSDIQCLRLNKRTSTSAHRLTHEAVEYSLNQDEMKVIIIYKIYDPECINIVKDMTILLQKMNCLIYLEENAYQEIIKEKIKYNIQLITPETLAEMAFLIVIGGDGTILYALKLFQHLQPPPIMAFQKGTLGFMCLFNIANMDINLRNQVQSFRNSNQFVVERKLRLQGQLSLQNQEIMSYHVLNEFVISRGSNPACLYLEIYINDVLLTVASGDGVIVATPTGSTAYFLSAGGPIVQNEVSSISIAPICPLSLSFRPIVLPDCLRIRIKLAPESRQSGFICCDGQETIEFKKDMVFEIQKSPYEAQIIQQQADDDYSIWVKNLRKKLSWNKVFTEKKHKL